MTTLIILNQEAEISLNAQVPGGCWFIDKGCYSKAIQNEAKEEKGEFLECVLGTLGAILLGNLLPSKGKKAKNPKKG